ncbi:membrane protein [Tepiditoga spiralis]|uniref:Membrane protein n=1 Tax=Tepiditoga spiralis TaxID=2108365 RepID=A0A7G1G4V0_9BACT|nr:lactate utilization protein [Tepiditoga spiralis]BBE31570.1 membrane protein [Tepiditoga spiralis]
MDFYKWKYLNIGERLVTKLKNLKHDAYLVENKNEVVPLLKKLMPENSKVGVGGSVTLSECNVLEFLRNEKFNFLDRYSVKTEEEKTEIYYENFKTDFFLCSANAITMDGKIVQLDGNGTRVAPMIWGPKNVIIVAGMNKVVEDLNEAELRLKFISPMNAKRVNAKTPCSRIGECIDCESHDRICIHKTILETGVRQPGRFKIILVAEKLGF